MIWSRWSCCGVDWSDILDHAGREYKFCPICGKPRQPPEPATSEDELLRQANQTIAILRKENQDLRRNVDSLRYCLLAT